MYVKQPPGYEITGQEDKVYRMKKQIPPADMSQEVTCVKNFLIMTYHVCYADKFNFLQHGVY